jgi:hypothetical protein
MPQTAGNCWPTRGLTILPSQLLTRASVKCPSIGRGFHTWSIATTAYQSKIGLSPAWAGYARFPNAVAPTPKADATAWT